MEPERELMTRGESAVLIILLIASTTISISVVLMILHAARHLLTLVQ